MAPSRRRHVALPIAAGFLAALAAASCGKKGPPRPPAPRGPLSPGAVEARQIGDDVRVLFTLSQPRGQKPSQVASQAELLRVDCPADPAPPPDPDAFRRRGKVVGTIDVNGVAAGTRLDFEDLGIGGLSLGGAGRILRYGVRIRDRKGRLSPLVVAADLAPVPAPPAPEGLSAEVTADGVRLSWRAPVGEGPFHFNVYRSLAGDGAPERPRQPEPIAGTEFLDSDVEPGKSYSYVIRTVAVAGMPFRESATSPQVTIVAEDRFAPARPAGLVAVQEGNAVRLFWHPGSEKDLSGYRVYRREDEGIWERVGSDPIDRPLYLDTDVRAGRRLSYRVTAVDRATPPNESDRSEPAEIDVALEPATSGGGTP